MGETVPFAPRRRPYVLFGGCAAAVVLICIISVLLFARTYQTNRRIPFTELPGVTVTTLIELKGDRAYPEAITVGPDGYLYSGSFCTGEIWRISPQGELEIWLPTHSGIHAVSGMAFAPDGTLYVADRGDCDPRKGISSLKRVLPDKTVEPWGAVSEDEILNGLTFDREGRLYAADTQLGEVRRYNENGEGQVWWELPANPNDPLPTGIKYDPASHAILVTDTNNGTLYRISIEENGEVGQADTLYNQSGRSLDGLTLDDEGRIIFTSFDNNEVVRLEADGRTTRLAKNFREPSDVAFLDGRVYVTNFDSLSLAPFISLLIDPSLPFTIDVIDLRNAREPSG